MTNEERTVQFPVSLIANELEYRVRTAVARWRAADRAGSDGKAAVDAEVRGGRASVLALLSQPNPTAEPSTAERWQALAQDIVDGNDEALHERLRELPGYHAEPPRIEGMAPGTTFTACWRGHVDPDQFVVLNDGVRCIAPGRWYGGLATEIRYATDRIDPSTIRDVTPPKGDDRG